MTFATKTGRFELGDLPLQSGEVLPGANLSWKTYGTLARCRDNVVVFPT
ncbi:homoserine acetyltransferase, partial [Neorhizobium sp. P12A]